MKIAFIFVLFLSLAFVDDSIAWGRFIKRVGRVIKKVVHKVKPYVPHIKTGIKCAKAVAGLVGDQDLKELRRIKAMDEAEYQLVRSLLADEIASQKGENAEMIEKGLDAIVDMSEGQFQQLMTDQRNENYEVELFQ
uniref:uncharacterized protein LOC120343063 n=1 Tax=Styela clava TaxID=7725 RepID=UPI00193961F5|nr:uncharacterized protein LOC120343063 [Styela clava]